MNRLGYALIGAGKPNIATSCHLPAAMQIPQWDVVLLMDVDLGVRTYAERCKVEWTNDFQEVLRRDDVHVVDICSPDWLHAEQVMMALEAGKHVICEKPLALSVASARMLADTAARLDRKLQIVTNYRYQYKWQQIKETIRTGKIGTPKMLRYSLQGRFFPYDAGSFYRKAESGGQFIHNGVHYMDLIGWLLDSEPETVSGRTLAHYPGEDRMETDNYMISQIRMRNGSLAVCELNMTMMEPEGFPTRERLSIVGDKGVIDFDNAKSSLVSFTGHGLRMQALTHDDSVAAYTSLFREYAESIVGASPQAVSADFSLRIFEACVGTILSAKTGKTIRLPIGGPDDKVWKA
ncbi:Gfo/Idh/MocA family protein [Paenibacillus oceani]|uniref:Gfo/Idh/MocA family oxidoreductase n=1 Tax=Paenibacillus oceani TaxID=2772510 RepID=A0A927CFD3_9BACL|nr:Gfo/Idh/MocA family oxidoreductase [Paenibacillus oceani]MBD2865582.1 Gfo/Idh/MocA family oxidoreductase [Paenibacillus oceani]